MAEAVDAVAVVYAEKASGQYCASVWIQETLRRVGKKTEKQGKVKDGRHVRTMTSTPRRPHRDS